MSDIYPPTPGSGNNSTDDLYASLLGDIGLAGRVPSSVSAEPVQRVEALPTEDAGLTEEANPANDSTPDDEVTGADYPLAPEVSRSSFVAPTTEDARAYASSSESGDPFETTPVVSDASMRAVDSVGPSGNDPQPSGPPTGAFTSPAAQNALPDAVLGANGRRRPTFDEVLYGTAPRT